MTNVYFNEIGPFCAQWIRNQFVGEVDERDIRNIATPVDALRQHYFAGIGGWEYALELAGWPQDREVWTGSCPCQPFSVAGKRQAHEDERDLWPAFFRLIAIARPAVCLGEQVSGAIAYGWLDRICDDLKGIGYAVGTAVLPACGVGAPHIRQRLYWVAIRLGHADQPEREARIVLRVGTEARSERLAQPSPSDGLAVAESQFYWSGEPRTGRWIESANGRALGGLELTSSDGRGEGRTESVGRSSEPRRAPDGLGDSDRATTARQRGNGGTGFPLAEPESHWAASRGIYCADGKWRRIPTEPGFQPLANGGRFGNPRINPQLSSRIGVLKASGNAICIPLAAEFVKAVMEVLLNAPPVARHGRSG